MDEKKTLLSSSPMNDDWNEHDEWDEITFIANKEDIKLPCRSSRRSIAFEIFSPDTFILEENEAKEINLGFHCNFSNDYMIRIFDNPLVPEIYATKCHIRSHHTAEWVLKIENTSGKRFTVEKDRGIAFMTCYQIPPY